MGLFKVISGRGAFELQKSTQFENTLGSFSENFVHTPIKTFVPWKLISSLFNSCHPKPGSEWQGVTSLNLHQFYKIFSQYICKLGSDWPSREFSTYLDELIQSAVTRKTGEPVRLSQNSKSYILEFQAQISIYTAEDGAAANKITSAALKLSEQKAITGEDLKAAVDGAKTLVNARLDCFYLGLRLLFLLLFLAPRSAVDKMGMECLSELSSEPSDSEEYRAKQVIWGVVFGPDMIKGILNKREVSGDSETSMRYNVSRTLGDDLGLSVDLSLLLSGFPAIEGGDKVPLSVHPNDGAGNCFYYALLRIGSSGGNETQLRDVRLGHVRDLLTELDRVQLEDAGAVSDFAKLVDREVVDFLTTQVTFTPDLFLQPQTEYDFLNKHLSSPLFMQNVLRVFHQFLSSSQMDSFEYAKKDQKEFDSAVRDYFRLHFQGTDAASWGLRRAFLLDHLVDGPLLFMNSGVDGSHFSKVDWSAPGIFGKGEESWEFEEIPMAKLELGGGKLSVIDLVERTLRDVRTIEFSSSKDDLVKEAREGVQGYLLRVLNLAWKLHPQKFSDPQAFSLFIRELMDGMVHYADATTTWVVAQQGPVVVFDRDTTVFQFSGGQVLGLGDAHSYEGDLDDQRLSDDSQAARLAMLMHPECRIFVRSGLHYEEGGLDSQVLVRQFLLAHGDLGDVAKPVVPIVLGFAAEYFMRPSLNLKDLMENDDRKAQFLALAETVRQPFPKSIVGRQGLADLKEVLFKDSAFYDRVVLLLNSYILVALLGDEKGTTKVQILLEVLQPLVKLVKDFGYETPDSAREVLRALTVLDEFVARLVSFLPEHKTITKMSNSELLELWKERRSVFVMHLNVLAAQAGMLKVLGYSGRYEMTWDRFLTALEFVKSNIQSMQENVREVRQRRIMHTQFSKAEGTLRGYENTSSLLGMPSDMTLYLKSALMDLTRMMSAMEVERAYPRLALNQSVSDKSMDEMLGKFSESVEKVHADITEFVLSVGSNRPAS